MTIIVHQKQNKIIKKVKKRALRDRSGEHGRAIQNKTNDAVPQDFDQKGHKLTDIELIKLLKVLKYSPHERGFLRLKYKHSGSVCRQKDVDVFLDNTRNKFVGFQLRG